VEANLLWRRQVGRLADMAAPAQQGADGVAPRRLVGGREEPAGPFHQFETRPCAARRVWLQVPQFLHAERDQHHQVLEEGPLPLVGVFVQVADAPDGELGYAGCGPVCRQQGGVASREADLHFLAGEVVAGESAC